MTLLKKIFLDLVDSFKGAKARCYIITKDPPKDESEISARSVNLASVKMQAYTSAFRRRFPSGVDEYSRSTYQLTAAKSCHCSNMN